MSGAEAPHIHMWHLMDVSGWICAQSTLFLEKQPLVSLGQNAS